MPKLFFLFCFPVFFLHTGTCLAQGDDPADNKNIGLCNLYTDTLSFDHIKNCETITINSDKKTVVTSYMLSYYLSDGMTLNLVHGFGNTISKEDLDKLMKIKPKAVFIEEVLGESDSEILILGHRWIYLK